ncbi:hypothetical protein HGRIS_007307 [Hohenbuehelia grisea]|uniref:Ribosomal protein/NADH dehydrogenase domain-containing protein n=1 Tax=Hohenbuehelia grisea TaxID=104357 RepID=A0ABR3J4S0_9AGAR
MSLKAHTDKHNADFSRFADSRHWTLQAAMVRQPRTIPGPSRLSKILSNLKAAPRLELANLRSLKLTLASRNDHFGARHFLKEDLPRIQWANPDLAIEVSKMRKSRTEGWHPELELQFEDGSKRLLDLQDKWSSSIVRELMDTAGAPSWSRWKKEAAAAGRPVLPGEENEIQKRTKSSSSPSLQATTPDLSSEPAIPDLSSLPPPKTGAAAVLP